MNLPSRPVRPRQVRLVPPPPPPPLPEPEPEPPPRPDPIAGRGDGLDKAFARYAAQADAAWHRCQEITRGAWDDYWAKINAAATEYAARVEQIRDGRV